MGSLRYAEIGDGACIISLPNETALSMCSHVFVLQSPANLTKEKKQTCTCDLELRGTKHRLTRVPYYVGADVLSFVID